MDLVRFLVTGLLAAIFVQYGPMQAIGEGDTNWFLLLSLYIAALVLGICEVLRDNAGQTILPSIVARDQLEAANGRFSAVEMVLNGLAGPPLAGFLIALAVFMPLATNALAFLFAGFMMLWIFVPARQPKTNSAPTHFMTELKEGIGWLWRFPLLRDLAFILGGVNAAFMMGFAIYVLFAQEVLMLDATGYGLLLTAGALGGVVGSFAVPWLGKWLRMRHMLLVAMALMVLENLAVGFANSFWFAWLVIFVGGVGTVGWNIHTVSFRQRVIPDTLLGRVNAVYRFFGWGMMPIGTLLGGLVVQWAEPFWGREWALRSAFLVAAFICLLLLLYALSRLTEAKIVAAERRADQMA
jgi:MFS family permease